MKSLLTLILGTVSSLVLQAQTIDYNKIILPDRVSSSISFEERLVQLSWRNLPLNKVAQTNVEIAHSVKKQAQWSWLDRIHAVGNVNEFTLNPGLSDRASFYPRYNFSLRLDMGMFSNLPQEVKQARLTELKSDYLVNDQKVTVRRDVLLSVQKLEERFKLIKLSERMKEDNYIMYKDAEEKFSLGDITIERYRATLQSYSLRMGDLIQARSAFNQEKIVLESLIGVSLEEVDGYQEYLVALAKRAQEEF